MAARSEHIPEYHEGTLARADPAAQWATTAYLPLPDEPALAETPESVQPINDPQTCRYGQVKDDFA